MSTIYVSKTGGDFTGNGTQASPYLTIGKALAVAVNGDTIYVSAGTYNEQVVVNKSLTINGAQQNVSAINSDGSIRNANESIVQGTTSGSGICFTITSNNVVINGFKCVLPETKLVRDAFNLKVTPAGSGNTATLENIVIKNNIIQNLRPDAQSHAILFGESTTNVNNASNGNGVWNNVEITNNYFDSSAAGNGYRGVQFSTHFYSVYYNNINIHDNRFINSVNITSNRAIGVTSYINAAGRGPTYLNSFKVNNNYFNTPGNSSIGGLFDCDANCEVSNNTFNNCKFGISSINFREVGGIIQNNNFTVTEYSIGINDNVYATTNGSNINIINNVFNGNPTKHIECSSVAVDFTNLSNNNSFNGYVLKSALSTYNQYDNSSNPLLNRVTRSIYPTITKGILAAGVEDIYVGAGTYTENITINKQINLYGSDGQIYATIQPALTTSPTIQITDGATGTSIKNFTVKGGFVTQSTTGSGNSDNTKSAILFLNTDTSNNPPINNVVLENLRITSASNGVAFNNKSSSNISIKTCLIEQNEGCGIRIASNTETMNGFVLDNCVIQNNNLNAISSNPSGNFRPNCTNYEIKSCLIKDNNKLTTNNSHDVSLFGFNGNITISNTNIECDHYESKQVNGTAATIGGWGLIIYGTGTSAATYQPSGNITISNVTMTGNVIKSCLGFDRYSTLGTIDMSNVDIKDCQANKAGQTWLQLAVGHRDTTKSFMLGNTKLKTIYTTNIGNVDATSSSFYDNTTGVLLDPNNLNDLEQINNQIYDKTDNPSLGEVVVVVGVTFANPNVLDSLSNSLSDPTVTTLFVPQGTYTQTTELVNNKTELITLISFGMVRLIFRSPV